MKQLIYAIALVLTLSMNAKAEPRGDIRPSDLNPKQKYETDISGLQDVAKSDDVHGSHCNLNLGSVESETAKTSSLFKPTIGRGSRR